MIHMNGVEEGRILINAINTSFLTKLNDSILPQSIKLSDELTKLDQQCLLSEVGEIAQATHASLIKEASLDKRKSILGDAIMKKIIDLRTINI